jgi:hypothetical protein
MLSKVPSLGLCNSALCGVSTAKTGLRPKVHFKEEKQLAKTPAKTPQSHNKWRVVLLISMFIILEGIVWTLASMPAAKQNSKEVLLAADKRCGPNGCLNDLH